MVISEKPSNLEDSQTYDALGESRSMRLVTSFGVYLFMPF